MENKIKTNVPKLEIKIENKEMEEKDFKNLSSNMQNNNQENKSHKEKYNDIISIFNGKPKQIEESLMKYVEYFNSNCKFEPKSEKIFSFLYHDQSKIETEDLYCGERRVMNEEQFIIIKNFNQLTYKVLFMI